MGGAELMPENPLAHEAPIVIGLHIIGSSAFCLLGALQSLPSIRQHHRNLHKNLGRIAGAGDCISVITGLVMTHQFVFSSELQGELLYWVRMVVGTAMLAWIVYGITAIRNRNMDSHRASMMRGYALGQGASTQAFVGITWMLISGTEATGFLRDVLMTSAWLINLSVTEYLIRGRSKSPRLAFAR